MDMGEFSHALRHSQSLGEHLTAIWKRHNPMEIAWQQIENVTNPCQALNSKSETPVSDSPLLNVDSQHQIDNADS